MQSEHFCFALDTYIVLLSHEPRPSGERELAIARRVPALPLNRLPEQLPLRLLRLAIGPRAERRREHERGETRRAHGLRGRARPERAVA